MNKVFFDALKDSLEMLPLLFLIYVGIEYVEFKFGNKIRERVQEAGKAGPAVGALAGSLPQCGFSVITAALYSQRLVTIGTLIAVYLSTSDEAIPVILSQPSKLNIILPLILTKVLIALVAGYAIDYFFRRRNKKVLEHIEDFEEGKCHHDHDAILEEKACCGHNPSEHLDVKELLLHPIVHTAKIFCFIFGVTFLLNFAFFKIGDAGIEKLFLSHSFFQPFVAAIIGLIPNCSASVALTELYLKGAINYGSIIAGLSAGGGLGLLVLFKENKNRQDSFKILLLLVSISIAAGLIIELISKF